MPSRIASARRRPLRGFRADLLEGRRLLAAAPSLVADLRPGAEGSYPSDFVAFNNDLYFGADADGSSHDELWKLDGAAARVADPSRQYFQIEGPTVLNGRLYFAAANGDDDGWELWRYDGGRSTRLLGADDGFRLFPPDVFAFGGSLLMWAYDGERTGLWKFDGSGATFLSPLLPADGRADHERYGFTVFNGSVYFRARALLEDGQSVTVNELWRYDGRSVSRAAGIEPGSLALSQGMAVLSGSLYFPARATAEAGAGEELWKYDGRSASLAADVLPGPEGSDPTDLTVLNGSLYFAALTIPSRQGSAGELWRYDPVTASATRLSELLASKPAYLTGLGDTLYFRGDDPDPDQPPAVWSYDGTAVRKTADLMLNNVGGFTLFRNALYFGADDGVHGFELWKIQDDAPPPPAARVVGRRVFYNNSAFDGASTAADARDDAAVAPDKQALLPGQRASFMHYTSYARGLNGVIIDVQNLPEGTGLDRSDFQFRAGSTANPATWASAPAPTRLVVRRDAGVGGSDRVTLVWADGAVANKWLQVTVRANADTGLARADVFYFGNMIAETGDFARTAADVTAADVLRTSANQRRTPVGLDSRYDFDRNRRVDWADVAWARRALPTTPLRLFIPPGLSSAQLTLPRPILKSDADEETDALVGNIGTPFQRRLE